jgi:hypothetical protein
MTPTVVLYDLSVNHKASEYGFWVERGEMPEEGEPQVSLDLEQDAIDIRYPDAWYRLNQIRDGLVRHIQEAGSFLLIMQPRSPEEEPVAFKLAVSR